jgi:nitroreductase
VHYKGLKKDYVGDVSVLVLVCGDPRTKAVYLTTRQAADREKLFQASIANAVQQMMLAAAAMHLGTVWVSVREEVEPELRELFKVPEELRLLWVVPIGHARSWPKAKPRRAPAAFTHWETYDRAKLRAASDIHAWPKS